MKLKAKKKMKPSTVRNVRFFFRWYLALHLSCIAVYKYLVHTGRINEFSISWPENSLSSDTSLLSDHETALASIKKDSQNLATQINNYCKSTASELSFIRPAHWLSDQTRSMSVCLVPKSGSTVFQKAYLSIANKELGYLQSTKFNLLYNPNLNQKIKPIGGIADKNVLTTFLKETSTAKAILLRHPFQRLYSGFNDKFNFVDKPGYKEIFGPVAEIIKTKYTEEEYLIYPNPGSQISNKIKVSFESFLKYIVATASESLDPHFMPASVLCPVCDVDTHTTNFPYDLIIKEEDLMNFEGLNMIYNFEILLSNPNHNQNYQEDVDFIDNVNSFYKNRLDTNYDFGIFAKKNHADGLEFMKGIFKRDRNLAESLYEKYKVDFLAFNYTTDLYF